MKSATRKYTDKPEQDYVQFTQLQVGIIVSKSRNRSKPRIRRVWFLKQDLKAINQTCWPQANKHMLNFYAISRELRLCLQNPPGIEDRLKRFAVYSLHQLNRSAAYLGDKWIVEGFPKRLGRKLLKIKTRYTIEGNATKDLVMLTYASFVLVLLSQ